MTMSLQKDVSVFVEDHSSHGDHEFVADQPQPPPLPEAIQSTPELEEKIKEHSYRNDCLASPGLYGRRENADQVPLTEMSLIHFRSEA